MSTLLPHDTPPLTWPDSALVRVEALLADGRRKLLGLVGAPGAGKSTLARALCDALGGQRAQLVPMDGFHLAQAELERLGRAARKGAPDTFDGAGYVALLERLRAQGGGPAGGEDEGGTVYAPDFRRDLEEPVAGAIGVRAQTRLVVTEGNYLLLDHGPWARVRSLLDEVWYVEGDERQRQAWLLRRHRQFGRDAQAARDWMAATDEPNARLIEATRSRAHRIFRLGQ